jgi:hypothetical protein
VECLGGHISTFSIKTLVIYFLYVVHSIHVPVISCSILLSLLDFIIVVRLFCSLFDFSVHLLFDFGSNSILCFSLFCCLKEKDSILILDCIPGILIPL